VPSLLGGSRLQRYRFVLRTASEERYSVVFGAGDGGLSFVDASHVDELDFFLLPNSETGAVTVESDAGGSHALLVAGAGNVPSRGLASTGETLLDVPEVSQIPFEREPERKRQFCAPTCLLMVARSFGLRIAFDDLRDRCFNANTNLYGVWPQLTIAANSIGLGGAVVFVDTARAIEDFLNAGLPVIASLKFVDRALPDFPFPSTAGHMVVIRGLSAGSVLVNDPAHTTSVARRYPLDRFMDVWSKSRPEIGHNIGLVFWPAGAQSRA
jgi:hypothetical protein